jgi:hypothetical protein
MDERIGLPLREITPEGGVLLDRQEMSFGEFCAVLAAVATYLDTATPENCPWLGSTARQQVAETAIVLLKAVGREAFEYAWAGLDGVFERRGA